MFRQRTLQRLAGVSAVAGGVFLIDKHLCYSTLQRNVYTLVTAAIITVDIKFNFQPEKAAKIDELHERVSRRILNCCKNNGGLYVKFGQQIATVPVLPPAYVANLKQLFDEAPHVNYSTVCKIFDKEFGRSPDDIFMEFDHEPIQSASIAQVHKARLKSGQEVAVKIQKPAIKFQIGIDMLCYRFLIFALEKVFDLPLYWTADYIEFHLRQETDFLNEARNASKCRDYLQKHDPRLAANCHIPIVFDEFTSERVMTAEWIDGISLKELSVVESKGYNPSQVMTDIIDLFSSQIFASGFVHADPHVANILLRPHPANKKRAQIVLLDHGLYVQCTEKFVDQYSKFWVSLLSMDTETTKAITSEWGITHTDMFASATIARPWQAGKRIKEKPTLHDLYESQLRAKSRIQEFLAESDRLPKELLFVGRNLNCIRANNKNLGSPVNRINLMARYANNCIAEREPNLACRWFVMLKFSASLFAIDFMHSLAAFRQTVYRFFGYSKDLGFESVMERQLGKSFQRAFNTQDGSLEINFG